MAYIFAFLMLIFSQGVVFADDNLEFAGNNKPSDVAPLVLTEEEQQWLAAHKQIEVAYDGSLPPYSFVNDSGQIDGVAVEIMALLSQRLGIRFTTYPNFNWANLYKAAANKRVDVVATMVNRPDRQDSFGFTKPYLTKSLVIVTKQDNTTINNRPDLENKKVAVVTGYQYAYQIKKEFPTVKSVEVPNMLTSLQKVEDGSVDAAIVFLGTANYLQTKHGLNSLRIAAYYDRNNANESIAIRKDWPILSVILQKGLDSLTEQEVQKIFAKWVVGNKLIPEDKPTPVVSQPPVVEPTASSAIEKVVDPAPVNIGLETQAPDKPTLDWLLLSTIAIFLVVASLFLFWLFLIRKQRKKRRVKVKNVMMTSVRNLQSEHNEAMHLTIEPPPVADEVITVPPIPRQQILANSEQIAYHRDCEGRMTYVSSNVTNLLGYSETDFMLNFRKYLTDNPVNLQLDEQMEATIQGQPGETYDIELYDAGQGVHWLRLTDTPIYNGQGHCIGIDGIMDDVTAQTLYDKVAVKSSPHDELAMPEPVQALHHLIKEAVHTATQNRQAFVLIYVMLDRLRSLDGESVDSDESAVLDESTRRLKATLRDTDVVMQFESNKFALVLPDTNGEMIGLVIEKIRKILQVPYLIGVHSIVLDANIGIAVYPKDGADPADLITEAQILLPSGEPQQVGGHTTAAEDNKEGDNLRLQQDLLAALDECKLSLRSSNQQNVNALHRHSQLSVYYQSRHNLEDYNITGFEALIRWRHPQIGIVLPYEFVPLINDIGLIDVMSYWIIQQVSFQAVAWEEQGIRPELITINLSDLAIKQTIDIQKIISIILEAGAKTEWLAISISESEVINNAKFILPIIKELASHGLVISIDNFGNDSNFLTLLADIPAQLIEIDPYFVRDVSDNYTNPEIITHTVTMLHEQGKTVILKEVETEAQLDFLKTTGCDMMQGYLLSRAVPSAEAKELMETFPDVAWYFQQK